MCLEKSFKKITCIKMRAKLMNTVMSFVDYSRYTYTFYNVGRCKELEHNTRLAPHAANAY